MNTADNSADNDGASRARDSTHSSAATPAITKAASILSTSTGKGSLAAMSRKTSVRQEQQQPEQPSPPVVHVQQEPQPAAARLKHDPTGSSHNISEVSKSNTGSSLTSMGATAPTTAQTSQASQDVGHVELEDTNDARMRTLRLGDQEEKIFYEPEPEMPKMTATSYPGQEWNPYGEPEFMMGEE
jgi:hypothetical protein